MAYLARAYWLPPSVDLCFTGEANIPLKETIPLKWGNTDVVFAFDQSGSMAPMIDGAKADAKKLMQTIAARFGSERFGVSGFSDYVDIPYRLYQPLTDDLNAVQTAINGLSLVDGGDLPEAYGRMMYESYADPSIGWRSGTWHYLVIFGDSYPHDPDAGRDGILGTDDDLILDNVLAQMKNEKITLIYVADPGIAGDTSLLSEWQEWTSTTTGITIRCANP